MGSTPSNLSASRGSAILGVNKYKSPLVGWLEIMEDRQPGFCNGNGYMKPAKKDPWTEPLDPKAAALRWGLVFEDPICDLIGGITDREKAFIHPKHDFLTCHIDGTKQNRLQENKTAFDMVFRMGYGEPGSAMIPEGYQVQGQHQSMCSGINNFDLNVLVFPRPPAEWEKMGYRIKSDKIKFDMMHKPNGRIYPISKFAQNLNSLGYFHRFHCPANPAAQKLMLKTYLHFWHENVLKETPPPVQGYDDIKYLIAAPEGEIKASSEMKELWQETIDIANEIESMIERQKEIKNNMAAWVQKEMLSHNIKPGNEKRKLNVYAGRRKLFSISQPAPGIKVSRSTVDKIKEDNPKVYETMKKTSFADILGDIKLTDKQAEKKDELDKFLGKLKLTKLLSRDSIMKQIKKSKPKLFKIFFEAGIIEETRPVSRLSISKPKE